MSRPTRRSLLVASAATLAAGSAAAQAAAPRVKFVTTLGEFVVEVYPDKAPKTAANFLQYVKDKHYDGTVFHRVMSDFMIQGGGMDASLKEKPTRPPVEHEGRAAMAAGLRNTVGMLAMARTPDPNSASAQFFINVVNNGMLDPGVREPHGYTVFGNVVSGMETVEKIRRVPTRTQSRHENVPATPVVITSATLM